MHRSSHHILFSNNRVVPLRTVRKIRSFLFLLFRPSPFTESNEIANNLFYHRTKFAYKYLPFFYCFKNPQIKWVLIHLNFGLLWPVWLVCVLLLFSTSIPNIWLAGWLFAFIYCNFHTYCYRASLRSLLFGVACVRNLSWAWSKMMMMMTVMWMKFHHSNFYRLNWKSDAIFSQYFPIPQYGWPWSNHDRDHFEIQNSNYFIIISSHFML